MPPDLAATRRERAANPPFHLHPFSGRSGRGIVAAPKAGDGEHARDEDDRRGVRCRSPRSQILRKTRSACDRCQPFHRMIGVYFSSRL
jgi:hypothetical protein